MPSTSLFVMFPAILAVALARPSYAEQTEQVTFDLADEVVCRLNTEAISKRQVEERMDQIIDKLVGWKHSLEAAGQWNVEMRKKYDELYIPPFRDALRRVVRERLMLQYAKADPNIKVDQRQYERHLKETLDKLRAQGLLNSKNFTLGEVEKRVRDNMLLEAFRWSNFSTVTELPSRPEVRKYYQDNVNRYQRPAGIKVRIIRIDRIVTSKLTGERTTQKDAYQLAKKLRDDVKSYSGKFEETAMMYSNDEETKANGGLIILNPKDHYFNPEGYNAKLAEALRGLEVGDISDVFELGEKSYAFVKLEDKREAGPAPLDGDLYEEIYKTLSQQKTRKEEDVWFRKALSKSLVVHVVEGVEKPLPVEFFFLEQKDETATEPGKAPAPQAKTEATPKGKG
ncbi:MAG: peptidylprolyl isomerase [Planctomycetota bacterium]|nr:peptidylprolyl isomerase [Planctomycetota bacterium]